MAKQRGIHQISGKINNLCYYEQKYVRGGLIRRINDAMSERLKSDPLFANTRRANTIFGGCSTVARALLEFFGSRNTYLFKPYRQALLTKAVKEFFLSPDSSLNYPVILRREQGFLLLPQIINNIVKNSFFDSFPEILSHYNGLDINDVIDFTFYRDSLVAFCKKYHSIGVQISVSRAHYIYSSSYSEVNKAYEILDYNPGGRGHYINWYLENEGESIDLSTDTGTIDDAVTFWIIYASPIVRKQQGRPVTGETGACCGMVTFLAT